MILGATSRESTIMVNRQAGLAAPVADDLKRSIVAFMRGASTEITPAEANRLPELRCLLPEGAGVYVAHTPNAAFAEVIRAALAVQRAGFLATPHIAVRRVPDARTLRSALAKLRGGAVESILLIAGDAPRPIGEFAATLDVLRSGLVEESGIRRIGIAGHPQGHDAVPTASLWEALQAKQAFALRTGVQMHIVTQFGFSAGTFEAWRRELAGRRIQLPVRVGIAGPAPIAKLLHFAVQCGIGASVRALMRAVGSIAHAPELAVSPDQHLLGLVEAPICGQVVAPHFFAFGGALETARWMRDIAEGKFEIDIPGARFKMLG